MQIKLLKTEVIERSYQTFAYVPDDFATMYPCYHIDVSISDWE